MTVQPDRDAETGTVRAEARRDIRRRLAELDREWTPERWAEARKTQLDDLHAA